MVRKAYHKLRLIFMLLLISSQIQAAKPNWSVVPNNYTFGLNITTKLSVNCNDLKSNNNLVAAFVNNECRGVTETRQQVGSNFLAYLTVYSNVTSGEQVTFKIYDASLDKIYHAVSVITFQDGNVLGNSSQPFVIKNNTQPETLLLSHLSVSEELKNEFVGTFSITDKDTLQTHSYSLVTGNGDTDNHLFYIANDSLFTNYSLDFETQKTASIKVRAQDNLGCNTDTSFTINILNLNEAPFDITLSASQISEHALLYDTIGWFTTLDIDSSQNYTYRFYPDSSFGDNNLFLISENALLINTLLDYEVKNELMIQIQSSDSFGLSQTKQFTISVLDKNDAPIINSASTTVSELGVINTPFYTINATDQDSLDVLSYNIVNTNAPFALFNNQLIIASKLDYETMPSYELTIKAEDLLGLSDTATVKVHVVDEYKVLQNISANTILSPNGDGKNDYFFVQNVSKLANFSLTIFNAEGSVIHHVNNEYDNTWSPTDYTNNAETVYYLFKNNENPSITHTGIITILNN